MPEWTTQQNNAINARGRNILVSAAAGSGKTAVLVERVIKKITDNENPVDIDKLLIVTFTNNAAAEMKSRITKSLKDILRNEPFNKNALRQLNLMSNAQICTIDSFCIRLVRENFFELGINQDFTNLDENESSLLEDNIINNIIDEHFEENDDLLIKVLEHFNKPDSEKPFINVIKRIRRFIYAQPFPYRWAYNMAELYNPEIPFENTVWYKYVIDEANYLISLAKQSVKDNFDLLKEINDEKLYQNFKATFQDDAKIIDTFSEKINSSWDDTVELGIPKLSTLPRTTKLDKYIANLIKANREAYKGILTKKIPPLFICSSEEYKNNLKQLYTIMIKLIDTVKEVDKRLMEEKNERNSYTFSDTEHFAINLLFSIDGDKIVKKDLANRLSDEFEEILVDEYQDTNEAQDLLFTYLSNGHNLFTVGDIKQSIYRFRLAMPNIFNDKRKHYALYDEKDSNISSKIILDKNFRSSKGICDYVNFVFSHLMSEKVGEINYDKQDWLNYGAKYEENDAVCAQINIIDKVKGEETNKLEALQIAKLIKERLKTKSKLRMETHIEI